MIRSANKHLKSFVEAMNCSVCSIKVIPVIECNVSAGHPVILYRCKKCERVLARRNISADDKLKLHE